MGDSNEIDKGLITRQRKRLQELNDEFIACRVGAVRHRWSRRKPDWEPTSKVAPLAFQCDSCLTVKRMEVDPKYGVVIGSPKYTYPEGYELKRKDGDGVEALSSPTAVRAELAALPAPELDIINPA